MTDRYNYNVDDPDDASFKFVWDPLACFATKSGAIATPRSKMSYPFLLELNPRESDEGKRKYTMAVLIPPEADIGQLKRAAIKTLNDEFGAEKVKELVSLNRVHVPFLDAFEKSRTEKNPAGDAEFKGWTMIRVSSQRKPGIVSTQIDKETGKVKKIYNPAEIYPGRWMIATLTPKAYPPIKGGKYGVAFYLQNVQLLEHDTPLAGSSVRAEDEFAPVDIGGEESSGVGSASADSVFD